MRSNNRKKNLSKSSWVLLLLLIFLTSSYSFSQIEKATKINYHLKTSAVVLPAIANERDPEDSDKAALVCFVVKPPRVDIHHAPEPATSLPVTDIISLLFREQSRMNAP